ncbi:MAG: aldo/keto reductase [Myxococcota bacterium]
MRKRTVGRTELRLSQIALGTWGLAAESYGPATERDLEETVTAALETGITTFDLAPLWGDGRAERVVGRATAARRGEVQYVTRAGVTRDDEGHVQRRFDFEHLVADCDASLQRLGTDRLDLWLLHNPLDGTWDRDDWQEAPVRLKREGKIRCWGASVSTADQARRALAAGADAVCLVHNLLACDDVEDLASDLAVAGCGVLARSPLAYGLLSGTWDETRTFEADDHRRHRWTSDALRQRIRQAGTLRFLIREDIPDMASASLRFVLSNPSVTCALVGARSPAQVRAAAAAVEGPPPYLSDEDLVRVSQVLAAVGV